MGILVAITRIDFEPVFLEPPYLSEIDKLRRVTMDIDDKWECMDCSWSGNDEDLNLLEMTQTCPVCGAMVTIVREYDREKVLREV